MSLKALENIDPYEYPDPNPVELPAELQAPETIDAKIKRIVAEQVQAKIEREHQSDLESLEEASDFDVEDSFDDDHVFHPHEIQDMEMEFPEGEHLEKSLGMETKPEETQETTEKPKEEGEQDGSDSS